MNQLMPVNEKTLKRMRSRIDDLESQVGILKWTTGIVLIVALIGWWF